MRYLFVLLLLLAGCTTDAMTDSGGVFTLHENETATVGDFNATVENFIYSPCPDDVTCVWSGIGIEFRFSTVNESEKRLVEQGTDEINIYNHTVIILDSDYQTFVELNISSGS